MCIHIINQVFHNTFRLSQHGCLLKCCLSKPAFDKPLAFIYTCTYIAIYFVMIQHLRISIRMALPQCKSWIRSTKIIFKWLLTRFMLLNLNFIQPRSFRANLIFFSKDRMIEWWCTKNQFISFSKELRVHVY